MLKYILCFLLAFVTAGAPAQESFIDSCIGVLPTHKEDTDKVFLLNKIAWDISYQDLQKGLDYIRQADSLTRKLNFEKGFASIDNTYGSIYMDLGMHNDAMVHFLHGIKVAEKYHVDHELANLLSNLAVLQQRRKEFKKATGSYKEAIAILLRNKDSLRLFGMMNNLASNYYEQHELDSAIYYYNICMQYNLSAKKELSLAYNYLNISDIYRDRNNISKAMQYIENAERIARDNKNNYVLSYALAQKADVLISQKNFSKALQVIAEALDIAKNSSDLEIIQNCELKLSNVYEGLGDYHNSLVHYRLYTDAKDSIMSSDNNKQIHSLEAQYGAEKKEKENKLLQAQNDLNLGTIRHQKTLTWLIAAGLLLSLCFVFFVLRGYRQKQKANELITLQKEEVEKQKSLVEQKSLLLEEKNKEVFDSIHYAKRIQRVLLTSEGYLKKIFPQHFVLYKPKDIVSGDFYWSVKQDNKVFIATADCTGHGVPGAFMSLVGISFLNEIVIERKITSPEKILGQLREQIIHALNPEDATEESKDGMDIALCCYDFERMQLSFASANNPLYLIRDNVLTELRPDKFPVGKYQEELTPFSLQTIDLKPGDAVYTFTDGYADQFGGINGKKYKYKQLREKLLQVHQLPLEEQKQTLDRGIESWRGKLEQVDDILIIGVRV